MILTKKNKAKEKRNIKILKLYHKLYVVGSDKIAVCEKIAEKVGISTISVYKIVNQ